MRVNPRSVGPAQVYFVSNQRAAWERDLPCAFRVRGLLPELWEPTTGRTRPAVAFRQSEDHTTVPITLAPNASVFVVFREPIPGGARGAAETNEPARTPALTLEGPWEVRFDPKWGGPASTTFDRLVSWTERPEEGIRYYSGAATYSRGFDLPSEVRWSDGRIFLDLGRVRELAAVRLNGRELGVLWTPPFAVEVTDVLRPRGNVLEVDVVNLWPNRLVGDARLPAEQRLTRTNIGYGPETPLIESGLLGPVTLQVEWR